MLSLRGSRYALVVSGLLISPEALSQCLPGGPDHVAWWQGEGDATDTMGSHDGTLSNGADATAVGAVGSAFTLDGTNDYVDVPDSSDWTFTGDFTVEFWVNLDVVKIGSVGLPGQIFIGHDEGGGNRRKWAVTHGANTLSFHINNPRLGAPFIGQFPFAPAPGIWYHVATVRSGIDYSFYVNGALLGTASHALPIPDANAPLTIGQSESLGFVDGRMDEVSIHHRALTASEIADTFAAGLFGFGRCVAGDADGDGVGDDSDVCPGLDDRADADQDGTPDGCDACPLDPTGDTDGDGVCDSDDLCPINNPDDPDGDGVCTVDDVCQQGDDFVDTDGDGGADACDACPQDAANDVDGDGLCESDDNCPQVANADQGDVDGDAIGDACEPDADADGIVDDDDNCPQVANGAQDDTDLDGVGDACDTDADGDGVADGWDVCPGTPAGVAVNPLTGCSAEQECPCVAPWKNHGAYVSCVAHATNELVDEGAITEVAKGILDAAAADSTCGKKK